MPKARHIQKNFVWREGNDRCPAEHVFMEDLESCSYIENLYPTENGLTTAYGKDATNSNTPRASSIIAYGVSPSFNSCTGQPTDTVMGTGFTAITSTDEVVSSKSKQGGYVICDDTEKVYAVDQAGLSIWNRDPAVAPAWSAYTSGNLGGSTKAAIIHQGRMVVSFQKPDGTNWLAMSQSGNYLNMNHTETPVLDTTAIMAQIPYSVIAFRLIDGNLYMVADTGIYLVTSNYGTITPKVGGLIIQPQKTMTISKWFAVVSERHVIQAYPSVVEITDILSGTTIQILNPSRGTENQNIIHPYRDGAILGSAAGVYQYFILDVKKLSWSVYSGRTPSGSYKTINALQIIGKKTIYVGVSTPNTIIVSYDQASYNGSIEMPLASRIILGNMVAPNRKKHRIVRIEVSYLLVPYSPVSIYTPQTIVQVTPDGNVNRTTTKTLESDNAVNVVVGNIDSQMAYSQKVEISINHPFEKINYIAIDFEVED